jgi:hypothetical protein
MIVQTMNKDIEKIHQRDKAAHGLQLYTKNNIMTEMMYQTMTQEIENVAQRNTNERNIIVVNEVIAAVVVVVVVAAPTTKRDEGMNRIEVFHTNLNPQIVRNSNHSNISIGSFLTFECE